MLLSKVTKLCRRTTAMTAGTTSWDLNREGPSSLSRLLCLLPLVGLDTRIAYLRTLELSHGLGHLISRSELQQALALLQHLSPFAVASLFAQLHQIFECG